MDDPADIHQKILVFCSASFAKTETAQCTGVVLFFAPGGGFKDDTLRSWVRTENPELFGDPLGIDKLVTEIAEVAEQDVNAKPPGSYRYVLRTKQHGGGYEKHSFSLKPAYNGDETALVTTNQRSGGGGGSATEAVLASNNQALMRVNQQMFDSAFRPLMQIQANLLDQMAAMREENSRLQREIAEAKSNNLEREWKIAEAADKNNRSNAMLATGMQVAKVIAAKIGGIDGGGNQALEAGAQLMIDWARTLRPDQVEVIMSVQDMSQKIMLMELFKMVQQQGQEPEQQAVG